MAFEPQHDLAQYLRDVARRLGENTMRVHEVALSDRDGDSRLFFRGEHAGAASLQDQRGPSVDVAVRTLDRVLEEDNLPGPVTFIKCDVEGHELAVFAGARKVLEHDKPVLLFESANIETGQSQLGPVTEYLRELGYEGYFFHKKTLHPFRDFSPDRFQFAHVAQQNFVFIPAAVSVLERNTPPYALRLPRRLPARSRKLLRDGSTTAADRHTSSGSSSVVGGPAAWFYKCVTVLLDRNSATNGSGPAHVER